MRERLHYWLQRCKPGGRKQSHLFLAALLWSVIGLMLLGRGLAWLAGGGSFMLMLVAFAAGTMKSRLILDRTAQRSIDRITRLQDGTCLGAVYSVRTWLLVLVMMASGMVLRMSSLPRVWLGFVYVTVGWALFYSSRFGWRVWRR